MKVLIFWDILGRMGRKVLASELPKLKAKYSPDFTVANIENCTSGRWPIVEHAREIEKLWVDIMTSWDHIYDQKDKITSYLSEENSILIRPANFLSYPWNPWRGYVILQKWDMRLLVVQLIGEVFMNHKVDNPFLKLQHILETIPRESYDACVVDFHRETTAELYGLGKYFDWKISLLYGTHTHIQTADAHIMKWGTGIIADVWMNGPHDGVIGASPESVFPRFLSGIQRWKIEQELHGNSVISALYAEIDTTTLKCQHIEAIRYIL